jgi:hypothetical protein
MITFKKTSTASELLISKRLNRLTIWWCLSVFALSLALPLASPDYLLANPGVESPPPDLAKTQPHNPVVDKVLRGVRNALPDARYNIQVYDLDGEILLRGDVSTEDERLKMASVANDVTSKRVRNELKVRAPMSDDEVAAKVMGALRRDYPGVAERVAVSVRDGVAYLSGDMKNHREVDEVLATALMVDGVRDIGSDMTLNGRPYRSGIIAKKRS